MRENKRLATIAALIGLLGFAAVGAAQRQNTARKAHAVELYAQFRDARMGLGGSAYKDRIHSDGKGPYYSDPAGGSPNYVLLSEDTGSLVLQIQPSELVTRQVVLEFDEPTRIVDYERLTCQPFHPLGSPNPEFAPPAYLATHASPNGRDRIFTRISTNYEYRMQTVTGANGDKPPGWVSTGRFLNLAAMTAGPGAKAYAGLSVWYWIQGYHGVYYLNLKNNGDPGVIAATGIAEVTHPDDRTWVLKPLSLTNSVTPGSTPANDEFRRRVVFYGQNPHAPGWCDMGDWNMPFELTLTRRY